MKNIAIITARSGSRGLKNKNIRPLNGKPLMIYGVEAALQSGVFEEVMVSTDSEEYAEIARQYGASVPFLRSADNSRSISNKWDAVMEVLEGYKKMGHKFDMFCVLQPTSPLRTADDIKNSYKIYEDKKAISVISVCKTEHSPLWANILGENKSMDGFLNGETDSQRQELPTYYRLNGAIYMMNVKEFYKDRNPYRAGSFAYIMPISRSLDIDGIFEFKLAEFCMKEGLSDDEF